ncbi:MAG: Fic family protein [Rhodothermia bacterium]
MVKIPTIPPSLPEILSDLAENEAVPFAQFLALGIGPAPGGQYRHWHKLKFLQPPEGLTSEMWWAGVKLARLQQRREIDLLDKQGIQFQYTLADPVLEKLHHIDRNAAGAIDLPDAVSNPQTKDRYLQRSLIEEAITSSQLEGATTTRQDAKEMIQTGRKPRDRSEKMILNNYQAMQLLSSIKDMPLSLELVKEIHSTITEGTLETVHVLRQPNDGIAVFDEQSNRVLHSPPPAGEIETRMQAMCAFANEAQTGPFLHPVLKAIILHFWLAYDHPFVDGNGRTARALFYWYMLKERYWLFEFISISSIIRQAPSRYGKSFLYTETDDNDVTYFLLSQLAVICRAIDELFEYLERKTYEIRTTTRLLRTRAGLNHRQISLLTHALKHPGMRYTIASHRRSHDVTYQTSRTDLLDLEGRGLLHRSRSGRAFVFTPHEDLGNRIKDL